MTLPCRIAAVAMSDRHGNAGISVDGVREKPPRVGWFAWRFKRLEGADEKFREQLNGLTRPKIDLEEAVQQSLAKTAIHEGARCPCVPGMAVTLAARKYGEELGVTPAWMRGLHPRRRLALVCLALNRGEPLPQRSPASK